MSYKRKILILREILQRKYLITHYERKNILFFLLKGISIFPYKKIKLDFLKSHSVLTTLLFTSTGSTTECALARLEL